MLWHGKASCIAGSFWATVRWCFLESLKRLLNNQSSCRWFETPWRLCGTRHCDYQMNWCYHWVRVTHICVGNLVQHCFRQWLVACSAPGQYLNQCWNIVNWTLGDKLQWKFNRNLNTLIHENAFENVIWEIAAILSRPQCVKCCTTREISVLCSVAIGHGCTNKEWGV